MTPIPPDSYRDYPQKVRSESSRLAGQEKGVNQNIQIQILDHYED